LSIKQKLLLFRTILFREIVRTYQTDDNERDLSRIMFTSSDQLLFINWWCYMWRFSFLYVWNVESGSALLSPTKEEVHTFARVW